MNNGYDPSRTEEFREAKKVGVILVNDPHLVYTLQEDFYEWVVALSATAKGVEYYPVPRPETTNNTTL